MALRILFEGTVAKHIDAPDDNEDAHRVMESMGRVVLSDGASESFDSRSWARLLVDQAITKAFSPDVLEDCIREYETLHDPALMSWSKAAAFERGSFATLLIAQDHPERNVVSVEAVGDSLAVWVDWKTLLATTPYEKAAQFEDDPRLLGCRRDLNANSEEPSPWTRVEWAYEEQGIRYLVCMTDALGEWVLARHEEGDPSAIEALLGIREASEFAELVERERAAGRLHRDDSTLIVACAMRT